MLLFNGIVGCCKRNCSEKLCKIHGKTFAMETFFSNAAALPEGTKKMYSY